MVNTKMVVATKGVPIISKYTAISSVIKDRVSVTVRLWPSMDKEIMIYRDS